VNRAIPSVDQAAEEAATSFDDSERQTWARPSSSYVRSFAKLCAYPVLRLLDAAGGGCRKRTWVGAGSAPSKCEEAAWGSVRMPSASANSVLNKS
jgi:hypothetical protein